MKNITYKTVLKYLGVITVFYIAEKIVNGVPTALAYYYAFAFSICSPIALAALYIILSFLTKSFINALTTTAATLFLCIVFCIYRKKHARPKFENVCYFLVALLPYLFAENGTDFNHKLVYSSIIAVLAFVLFPAFDLCFIKKLRCKGAAYELASCFISVVYTSLGGINAFGYKLWYDIALTAVLFLCYYFKNSRAFIPALVLPIALSIHAQTADTIAVFMLYCGAVLIFANTSRLLSALSLFIAAFIYNYFNGNFFIFEMVDYLYAFAPMTIFLFTPDRFYRIFDSIIVRFDEPEITRELINAERGELSAKLYGISDAFLRLEKTLDCIENEDISRSCQKIADEVFRLVCKTCNNYSNCKNSRRDCRFDMEKVTKIGLSKGKASLGDIPKSLSNNCIRLNDLIYKTNRLIALLTEKKAESERVNAVKKLLTIQAGGLSDTLKDIAYSLSDRITFGNAEEKKLFNALAYEGVVPNQLIRAGKNYHLLLSDNADFSLIPSIITQTENAKYRLLSKTDVGNGILAVYSPSPTFDACFGFAKRTKMGSTVSGDNYSVNKIDEGRFLIALCDGMGSGKIANENSQIVISLIENFFTAGLDRDVILNVTSNLISSCFDDGFATLDAAVVDLYEGRCDIIKIGASFGFVLSKEGVRVIENNSLPLGVLEKVEPTVQSLSLADGNSLIIMSDGVTDAFFSSTDAVDFLLRENNSNPQTFADKIMDYALSLTDNLAKDDMTVLVVKIYANDYTDSLVC